MKIEVYFMKIRVYLMKTGVHCMKPGATHTWAPYALLMLPQTVVCTECICQGHQLPVLLRLVGGLSVKRAWSSIQLVLLPGHQAQNFSFQSRPHKLRHFTRSLRASF